MTSQNLFLFEALCGISPHYYNKLKLWIHSYIWLIYICIWWVSFDEIVKQNEKHGIFTISFHIKYQMRASMVKIRCCSLLFSSFLKFINSYKQIILYLFDALFFFSNHINILLHLHLIIRTLADCWLFSLDPVLYLI